MLLMPTGGPNVWELDLIQLRSFSPPLEGVVIPTASVRIVHSPSVFASVVEGCKEIKELYSCEEERSPLIATRLGSPVRYNNVPVASPVHMANIEPEPDGESNESCCELFWCISKRALLCLGIIQ